MSDREKHHVTVQASANFVVVVMAVNDQEARELALQKVHLDGLRADQIESLKLGAVGVVRVDREMPKAPLMPGLSGDYEPG